MQLCDLEKTKVSGGGNGFKSLCPYCGGHNLYVTPHNGFAYCFNCFGTVHFEGSERSYTRKFDCEVSVARKLYTDTAYLYKQNIDPRVIEFLKRRGFDETTIDIFDLGYCPINLSATESLWKCGLASRGGSHTLAGRITIPYKLDDVVTDIRGRSLDGEDPKYKSLYFPSTLRGAIFPFNWDRAVAMARDKKYLLVTEGEFKAVAADQYGYPICALPGISSWRPGLQPLPEWPVIVIFDSMAGREKDLYRSIIKISKKIKNLFVGILPLLGFQKMDIDLLLTLKNGVNIFDRVVREAIPITYYKELRRYG